MKKNKTGRAERKEKKERKIKKSENNFTDEQKRNSKTAVSFSSAI